MIPEVLATSTAQAVGSLLPLAVAVAISPIPIIAVVIILGTPRSRVNGPAFGLGWVGGLTAVTTVVLVLTSGSGADDPGSSAATGTNWVQVALGVVLLVLAARQWRGRPGPGEQAELPGWMEKVDHFGPAASAGAGVVLSAANPKNLLLAVSAGAAVGQAGLSGAEDAVALAAFVMIGSLTVVGAVVYSLVDRKGSATALAGVKSFMADHNAVIMTVLLGVIGAKVLGQGIGGAFS